MKKEEGKGGTWEGKGGKREDSRAEQSKGERRREENEKFTGIHRFWWHDLMVSPRLGSLA